MKAATLKRGGDAARESDVLALVGGTALFAIGAVAARHPEVGRRERLWFGWVNRLPERWFRPVWLVMQLGSLGGVAVVSAAVFAGRRPVVARRVATSGLLAWSAAKAVKRFVGRGRPAAVVNDARVLGRAQTGLGYPSGHAAVTAAMGYVAAAPLGPATTAWLIPLLVGGSRVYVGAHLPLDVAGGIALGVGCGAAARLAESLAQGSRVTPASRKS